MSWASCSATWPRTTIAVAQVAAGARTTFAGACGPGAGGATTWIVCVVVELAPSGSVAVTVTVNDPAAVGVTLKEWLPDDVT